MNGNQEKLPREFGKYHLIERIAAGGMAELYRAKLYGAGGFEKDLAIKKVLPQLADDESFTKMFMDEAMITVTLSHGNIVSVIDFGVQEGDYYLVMEFVDGVDLQSLVKRSVEMGEPFPPAIASYIALEVCRGLDYAHRKVGPDGQPLQIVHRDISPQNILISFEGEVKIVDFGIARAASRITSTQAGVVKGKLAYMAPEQIGGLQVDRRADVYAVGVSLYEMLTNRRPFEGETPQQTLASITSGSYIKPQKLNRKVDKRLAAVVRKALERNPKKRYQTAGEMAADLSSYLHKAGIYPDASTLAAFIPQRLPDAKPRTIQPTPIRAIRRETAREAMQATGVMGNAAAAGQPAVEPPAPEAVPFDVLGLQNAVEPADSRRPTDPQYPASPAPEHKPSEEFLRAQTMIQPSEQQGPADSVTPAAASPAEATAGDAEKAALLQAQTVILGNESSPEPAPEPSPAGEPPAAPAAHDPQLLQAQTMILPEQPAADTSDGKPEPAAGDDLADQWLEQPAAAAGQGASPDTGALAAAALPRRNPLKLLALLAALVAAALVVIVLWPDSPTPPEGGGESGPASTPPAQSEKPPVAAPAPQPRPAAQPGPVPGPAAAADAGRPPADAGVATPKPAAAQPATARPVSAKPRPEKPAPRPAKPVKHRPVAKPRPGKTRPAKTRPAQPRPQAVARARGQGTLRINSEPFSVIYLGRKKLGPTPQMNLKLPVGSHTLTLRNDALGIKRRIRVRIQPDKVHTVFVDLNQPPGG